MCNCKQSKGFSLIELMIVIAIIGILAAIAVPSYQSYVKKAKISLMIDSFDEPNKYIQEYYSINGSFPICIPWKENTVCNFQSLPVSNIPNAASIFYWSIGVTSPITGGPMVMYGADATAELGGGLLAITAAIDPDSGGLIITCGYANNGTPNQQETWDLAPASCQAVLN